jgi:hypothetical protein
VAVANHTKEPGLEEGEEGEESISGITSSKLRAVVADGNLHYNVPFVPIVPIELNCPD